MRTLMTLAMLAGVACIDMQVAKAAPLEKKRQKHSGRDYSTRSGFPKPAAEMRGIATRPSTRMTGVGGQSGIASAVSGGASTASAVPMARTAEPLGSVGQASS
jgi:hypothetical protein